MEIANSALISLVMLSILMFFGSIVATWIVIVRIPCDYLTREDHRQHISNSHHPVIRIFYSLLKNLCGLILVVAGIIMLVTPGQGVLSIFVGLLLIDFPGKTAVVRRVVTRPRVLNLINRIRRKSHQPPLKVPSKP